MKKVWALYRVSTDKQVTDGNDIPMQEKAVKEFVFNNPDWKLCLELKELGVSGFKKSVSQRDKLQQIKKGAENGEFDVLVVFMSDRLGRNKHEIPFLLEYMSNLGIEVWSVKEGLLNEGTHESSLITYVRYWQAEGESKKTSIRVKEAHRQMQEENLWVGGNPAFGYEIYETGKKHPKRNKIIKDLRINEEDAKLVKLMFYLVYEKRWGSVKIANFLNENGYRTKANTKWMANTINRMLKNPIYIGYTKFHAYHEDGTLKSLDELQPSQRREDLVIIPDEVFFDVQDIVNKRHVKNKNSEPIARNSKYALLNGILYCGYCGKKLSIDGTIRKRKKKNGEFSTSSYYRYRCHSGIMHREEHVVSYFPVKKIDKEVENIVIGLIKNIDFEKFSSVIEEKYKKEINSQVDQKKKISQQLEKSYEEIKALKQLIVKIAMGQSKIPEEYVTEQIQEKEMEIEKLNKELDKINKYLLSKETEKYDLEKIKTELLNWEEKYEDADFDLKKGMISRIVESVRVKKDEIDIDVKFSLDQAIKEQNSTPNCDELYVRKESALHMKLVINNTSKKSSKTPSIINCSMYPTNGIYQWKVIAKIS